MGKTKKEAAAEKDPLLDEEKSEKAEKAEEASADDKKEEKAPPEKAEKAEAAGPSGTTVREGNHAIAAYNDNVAKTKEKLWKGPLTNFLIPLMPGEKVGAYEMVSINGYQLTIKKGAMVEIPVPVAKILAKHYQVEMEAGQEKRIDRGQDVVDALS